MKEFAERLKLLRMGKQLTQVQLAKETELSQSGIALWENGERIPSAQVLLTLAEYFNVTTDYLLGRTDE